jgi:hypothetical protein
MPLIKAGHYLASVLAKPLFLLPHKSLRQAQRNSTGCGAFKKGQSVYTAPLSCAQAQRQPHSHRAAEQYAPATHQAGREDELGSMHMQGATAMNGHARDRFKTTQIDTPSLAMGTTLQPILQPIDYA